MNVSVVVPWRARGCPHRAAAWARVQEEWDGWDVFTADDGGDPFSRGASINQGVDEHPADVYVFADADVLVDGYQVQRAVQAAAAVPGIVLAYDRYAYLTEKGTRQALNRSAATWDVLWTLEGTVSSCLAVSAETWDAVGGFDARFRAWGMEDVAFEIACRTLAGPTRRVTGTAYHLWHPTEPERPAENVSLLRQYERADGKPDELRALMAGNGRAQYDAMMELADEELANSGRV